LQTHFGKELTQPPNCISSCKTNSSAAVAAQPNLNLSKRYSPLLADNTRMEPARFKQVNYHLALVPSELYLACKGASLSFYAPKESNKIR